MFEPRTASSMRSFSARSAAASSTSRRSDMSRNTSTTPVTAPRSSTIGEPQSSIGITRPSRATSAVWFARPTTVPSRSTLLAGSSTGSPVSSAMMRNTSASGRPRASSTVQPVSEQATGFMNVTRTCSSVAITASPMLDRVTA